MQEQIQDLIQKKAQQNSLPEYVIEDIYRSQFQFLRKVMKEGKESKEFKSLYLHKFGVFYPSQNLIKVITENKRLKDERIREQNTKEENI